MSDQPQTEEEVPAAEEDEKQEKKEEEEEDDPHKNELTEEERAAEAEIQKKLEEIMGRDPKPWPGDGKDLYESKDSIEFKWNRAISNKRECDTQHMLYLLQKALEKVRARTNERNKYFRSINRKDRFIAHLDAPQIITNFLEWHNKDPDNNKFDGDVVHKSPEMHLINEVIAKIGDVRLGPATKIVMKMKEVHVDSEWSDIPQPRLYLKTRGWDRLYKGDKVLAECTVDEVVTILEFVGEAASDDEKKEEKPVTGIFDAMERENAAKVKDGKKSAPLLAEAEWKAKVVKYFRDKSIDGAAFIAFEMKALTQEIMNAVVPITELNEKGKPRNNKLRGGVKGMLNQLKGSAANTILVAAANKK